jgi:glycosyltransferase involved in cell wall biosynthesis
MLRPWRAESRRHRADASRSLTVTITMVTSSYPRFAGDAVATFMEPIATGVASLGHDVHMVAPWTPLWKRGDADGGVHFHLYRYAPARALNTFGYAAGMRADVRLRVSAMAVAPLALAAGWNRARRVARATHSSIVHAHWVIPSGVIAAALPGPRPLVISLHGSDVFVAEKHHLGRVAARAAFARAAWVTACSADLRDRAVGLGAAADRISVVPYGVDTVRFAPLPAQRAEVRRALGIPADAPMVLAFGRLVEKKGFAYLVAAAAILSTEFPDMRVVIAGGGDLDVPLRERARTAGMSDRILFPGMVSHDAVPGLLAAADVAVAPSIRDDAGNVDGLPNSVLEVLASGTPLVTTLAGGIGAVAADGRNARIVAERDADALAGAIADLLRNPLRAGEIGLRARDTVCRDYGWPRVAATFDDIYRRVLAAHDVKERR